MLGNPPWDTRKPKSQEFFSNIDPLYRTYGKREAEARQAETFAAGPAAEREWLLYNSSFTDLSHWTLNAAYPFGDGKHEGAGEQFNLMDKPGQWRDSDRLHALWRTKRAVRHGYADSAHPFRHQGSADINTYKMFLELCQALLRSGGRLGMIVPSGVYTDRGAVDLRTLFLDHCRWEWLFGFENREKVFDIDSRFKFCPVVVRKGGRTERIRAAFMHRDLGDWENAEAFVLDYPRDRVERFSPQSKAILELRSPRDLAILERIYANSVLLGDDSPDGWGIQYAREFDMTNDAKLFPPRPKWEEQGYVPDEYGHWLKGKWQRYAHSGNGGGAVSAAIPGGSPNVGAASTPRSPVSDILSRPVGLILSRDGTQAIRVEDIEDVALPLYEGRMIDQFDFSAKGWVSGKGRSAVWRDIPWGRKTVQAQFLIARVDTADRLDTGYGSPKIVLIDVGSATNARTMYAALVVTSPCGHTAPTLSVHATDLAATLSFTAVCNTFAFDAALRLRLGGLHLTWHYLEETPVPRFAVPPRVASWAASLGMADWCFAPQWEILRGTVAVPLTRGPMAWALALHERLRLRCILDAVVAELYGLGMADFAWILRDCDHPVERTTSKTFARTLDPKGFWRVDKTRPPELRHTVLAQVAFQELRRLGLDVFLALNEGDGWMLPETLTLADYGLGHDNRARTPQPVATALGPRFLDWQLAISPEDSWAACRRHADNIRRIRAVGSGQWPVGSGQSAMEPEARAGTKPGAGATGPTPAVRDQVAPRSPLATPHSPPLDLFGNPIDTDLFGNPVADKRGKRRR